MSLDALSTYGLGTWSRSYTVPSSGKYRTMIGPSQHICWKGRSFLSNLVSFCDKTTHLLDEENTVNVFYLDFSKVLDSVFHSDFLKKLDAHRFNRYAVQWVK